MESIKYYSLHLDLFLSNQSVLSIFCFQSYILFTSDLCYLIQQPLGINVLFSLQLLPFPLFCHHSLPLSIITHKQTKSCLTLFWFAVELIWVSAVMWFHLVVSLWDRIWLVWFPGICNTVWGGSFLVVPQCEFNDTRAFIRCLLPFLKSWLFVH